MRFNLLSNLGINPYLLNLMIISYPQTSESTNSHIILSQASETPFWDLSPQVCKHSYSPSENEKILVTVSDHLGTVCVELL